MTPSHLPKALRRFMIRHTATFMIRHTATVDWVSHVPTVHTAVVDGLLLRLVRRNGAWHLYARHDSGHTSTATPCGTDITKAKRQAEQLGHEPWLLTWPGTDPS